MVSTVTNDCKGYQIACLLSHSLEKKKGFDVTFEKVKHRRVIRAKCALLEPVNSLVTIHGVKQGTVRAVLFIYENVHSAGVFFRVCFDKFIARPLCLIPSLYIPLVQIGSIS